MGLLDSLTLGGPLYYPPSAPTDQPSIYASPEEWAAYRQKEAEKKAAAEGVRTNNSGMTPQQMELAATMQQLLSSAIDPAMLTSEAGAGRGVVNPPAVGSEPAVSDTYRSEGRNGPKPGVDPQTAKEDGILGQAFPEVFRNSPPTGKVNTKGGVDRVNARTSEHGVTAIERDGKIYMTNLNPDGTVNKGTGSPNSVLGDGKGAASTSMVPQLGSANVAGDIQNSVAMLQKTDDYAVARGVMANLNSSIAQTRAQMEADAIKMASTKFRIPELEAMVNQSVQTDMQSVGWYPGIGDSPVTSKLRAELVQATSAATAYSKTYLNSNASYAAINAAAAVATMEFERIKTNATREDALADRRTANSEEWQLRRRMVAQDEVDTLTPEQLKRMALLNPSLAMPDPKTGKPDPISISKFMKDKSVMEAVTAVGDQLPLVALEGNSHARVLLARQEAHHMTEQQVDAKLQEINKRANSPAFLQEYTRWKHQGNDKAAKEEMAAIQTAKVSTDAAGKKAARQQLLQGALEMERSMQTTNAINNITNLLPRDGIFKPAIEQSIKVTGNATLANVLNAVLEGAPSAEERMKRVAAFSQAVIGAASNRQASIFGRPDVNVLKQEIVMSAMNPFQRAYKNADEFLSQPMGNQAMALAFPVAGNLLNIAAGQLLPGK